jgi:hypothetical protein
VKQSRDKLVVMVVLTLIAFGAAITASVFAGWLILAFFLVGGLCAWQVVGSIFAYAQARAAEQLRARFAEKLAGTGARRPASDIEGTQS